MNNLPKVKCILCDTRIIKNLSMVLDTEFMNPTTYKKYYMFLSYVNASLNSTLTEYMDSEICVTCFDHHTNNNQDYINKQLLKQRLLR